MVCCGWFLPALVWEDQAGLACGDLSISLSLDVAEGGTGFVSGTLKLGMA